MDFVISFSCSLYLVLVLIFFYNNITDRWSLHYSSLLLRRLTGDLHLLWQLTVYSYFMFHFLQLLIQYKYFFLIFCQFIQQLLMRTLLESLLKSSYITLLVHTSFDSLWNPLSYLLVSCGWPSSSRLYVYSRIWHSMNCLSNLANF